MTMQVRSPHSHIVRDDLRGPLLPVDALSHISRINDWQGSDAWVEGCRADKHFPEFDMSDYPEPKLPYRLLSKSFHEGAVRQPGEVVYVRPSERGTQHMKIEGQEYPDMPEPSPPGTNQVPRMSDEQRQAMLYMQGLERRVAALEQGVADLHAALSGGPSPAGVQRAVADVQVPSPDSPLPDNDPDKAA